MNSITANFCALIIGSIFVGILALPENQQLRYGSKGEPPLNIPYFVECGGELGQDISAISYKPDVSVASYERCVWTIRSPAAIGYYLEVLSFGLQEEEIGQGIRATCILPNNTAANHYQINATGVVSIPDFCPVLVLTFYTGENVVSSRGFVALYRALAGTSGISNSSKHYDVTSADGHLRHPTAVEQNYTNSELSTFIFAPPNNVHNPERRVLVTYIADSLEGTGCNDNIRVHHFNAVSGWQHTPANDYLCGNIEYKSWISDDLIMLVFRTNTATVGRGFHITHTNIA